MSLSSYSVSLAPRDPSRLLPFSSPCRRLFSFSWTENMSWHLPMLTTISLAIFSLWWYRCRQSLVPRSLHLNAHAALISIAFLIDYHCVARAYFASTYRDVVSATPIENLKMGLTLCAIVWLLYRAWQTLWRPVPELVNVLGVDVPQCPDVCLAGIGSDSATLNWTRAPSSRPVKKYMIQVNGVYVGDSPGKDAAITVIGLRPSHFYTLRVIAVGPNNFRAGSRPIRIQTFAKDGKPVLGDSRLPSNFVDSQLANVETDDESDKSDSLTPSLPTAHDKNSTVTREQGPSGPGQRRNTMNRRHSPSIASTDQPLTRSAPCSEPEMSLAELNERFEGIRREIEDTLVQFSRDEGDFQQQEDELRRERDRKRQVLKEKEEQTTQLKAMIRTTMEQMRAAEKERAKKEQLLKDRETKKAKIRESIIKFESDLGRMRSQREGFETQKVQWAESKDQDLGKLEQDNAELQESCSKLEAELKDKGKQLQDLKATRTKLPGADEDKWREEEIRMRRIWEIQRREIHQQLVLEVKEGHKLDQRIREISDHLAMQQQRAVALGFYSQASSAAGKRAGHHSHGLGKADRLAHVEHGFHPGVGFGNTSFAPRHFIDVAADGSNEGPSDADLRAVSGPLSPSAQSLLPSNIFEETEADSMPHARRLAESAAGGDEGSRSPTSPTLSFNAFSSPHSSTHNLARQQYMDHKEAKSLRVSPGPDAHGATSHRFATFLSSLQRGRGAKTDDDDGPPIGSLKPGQSQSFPTVADADESQTSRRRGNFYSWMSRGTAAQGRLSPATPLAEARQLSVLRPALRQGSPAMALADRDSELSRPASIASLDVARPSTDSGSIWGAPPDGSGLGKHRLWSPGDGRWLSRSASRRPSLQACNAPTTTLASADDEILDEHDLLNPESLPSQIGVIGSRPPGSASNQRLNPAAPTFMATIFRKDKDRARERTKEDRARERTKEDRARERTKEDRARAKEEKLKAKEELQQALDDSHSDSRASRDTYSLHTQTSVSESRESLQLDSAPSNPLADVASSPSIKDSSENVVRKLFRKGSSSKFGLSTRLGKDSGLFKKSPGSAANSDRPLSVGDADDLADDAAVLGRSYDSMASSASSKPAKEGGRISSWRWSMSSIKKKGKEASAREKESLELDRAPDEEWTR
ncbi:hypothetical protein CDD81_4377 [Ophiocordyceps australis]|uniref:Fibronectin type-III domain-containing protein n=1 Tax=Ophiocordyceps australis TaxID=1399860 RepID=A0A2C5YI62_9HYPO|nr:hypothetical protein CDD81_4377 [Ophiocordyceps australis]